MFCSLPSSAQKKDTVAFNFFQNILFSLPNTTLLNYHTQPLKHVFGLEGRVGHLKLMQVG
jgi:hypothetical protein